MYVADITAALEFAVTSPTYPKHPPGSRNKSATTFAVQHKTLPRRAIVADSLIGQRSKDNRVRDNGKSMAQNTNNLACNHKTAVRFFSRETVAEASAIELGVKGFPDYQLPRWSLGEELWP
jgi:hypothetical protein